jgi:hypothetical protein
VLSLVVPRSVAAGNATLTVAIRDAHGDHRTFTHGRNPEPPLNPSLTDLYPRRQGRLASDQAR